MVARPIQTYYERIIENCEKITKYTLGVDYEKFCNETIYLDIVITPLTQIGETAVQIIKRYPDNQDAPRRIIVDMRNFLIHSYHKIDRDVVRETVQYKIPELQKIISEKI